MHSHCPDSASSLCRDDNSSVSFSAEVPIPGDGSTLSYHCQQERYPAPSNSCARLSNSPLSVPVTGFPEAAAFAPANSDWKAAHTPQQQPCLRYSGATIHFIKGQRIEIQRLFQAGIFCHAICQLMDTSGLNPESSTTYCFKKPSNVSFLNGLHLSTYS